MTAKIPRSLIKKIEQSKKAIAKERDKLRDYIDEVLEICDSADNAVESLERATDELSQFL